MVAESWFHSLWKSSWKRETSSGKVLIGVLAFEVSSLTSKLVHLWQSLNDKQIVRSREEIMNSMGIRKLISDDDDYIVGLICAEMIENLGNVARAVARLAKKCNDPLLKSFDVAFDDLIKIGADPYGWKFTWKKMDRKIKKMERFIMFNANLYQQMETLADLEQTLRRMKGNGHTDNAILLEFEKKVAWEQQKLKHLKDTSLWNRTYDDIVRLFTRSLFTIYCRIEQVFGANHVVDLGTKDSRVPDSDYFHRSHSVSLLTQSSVHPSQNSIARFSSGPFGRQLTQSGPISRTNKTSNFYSGPLGNSITTSSPTSGRHNNVDFYSGPLVKSATKSGPLRRANKFGARLWQSRDHSFIFQGKGLFSKSNRLSTVGPFKGCMTGGNSSNSVYSRALHGTRSADVENLSPGNLLHNNLSILNSKNRLLNAPPETLGAAALSLHYANVIIVIEKLVSSPHLIGHDARDDLYNMLPTSVRAALRAKLKPYTKSLSSSVYDTDLAEEWSEAMSGILEWLAPLAHNMIRWQSERSFEHHNLVSRTNVLLVQTLHFANQEKTEATITELLVGLNYIWRSSRELDTKPLLEYASGLRFDNSVFDFDG